MVGQGVELSVRDRTLILLANNDGTVPVTLIVGASIVTDPLVPPLNPCG